MKSAYVILILGMVTITSFTQTGTRLIRISKDIELLKLSENAYQHISYFEMPEYGRTPANGLIFVNNKEAFVFDSPWNDSLTKILFTFLRDSLGLKIVGFIPNHWHRDCMGGLRYIRNEKIESYANQLTLDIARSKNLPIPEHGFKDSLKLNLGKEIIECYYPGPAHTTDNIVVWIPSEKILFAGCMVKSSGSKDLGNTADGDLRSYATTIQNVAHRFPHAEIIIPGHGQAGGQGLLNHTLELLRK